MQQQPQMGQMPYGQTAGGPGRPGCSQNGCTR